MKYVGESQNYRFILNQLSEKQWNTSFGFEFYKNNIWSENISYAYEKTDNLSHSNPYQFNIK